MTLDEYQYERIRMWRDAYLAAVGQGDCEAEVAAEEASTALAAFDTAFPKSATCQS